MGPIASTGENLSSYSARALPFHPSIGSALETEFKLLLADAEEMDRLRSYLPSGLVTIRQDNHYYADHEGPWAAAGLVLRLRNQDGRWILGLKGKAKAVGDAVARPEWEVEVAEPPRVEDAIARHEELVRQLGAAGEHLHLASLPVTSPTYLGCLSNSRERIALPGAEDLFLELDHSRLPGDVHLYEVELEVAEEEDLPRAEEALRALFRAAGIPWRVGRASKFRRFLDAQP